MEYYLCLRSALSNMLQDEDPWPIPVSHFFSRGDDKGYLVPCTSQLYKVLERYYAPQIIKLQFKFLSAATPRRQYYFDLYNTFVTKHPLRSFISEGLDHSFPFITLHVLYPPLTSKHVWNSISKLWTISASSVRVCLWFLFFDKICE